MNRSIYFDYIEEKVNLLATRINSRGKLNILNLHIHSEDFYVKFLNIMYGWDLSNLNEITQNVEAIDLIDNKNKIIVQVSATNTKAKVEDGLSKDKLKTCNGFTFKFVFISNDADNLRNMNFKNPHGVNFTPSVDIIDKKSILNSLLSVDISKIRIIYAFIKDELGSEPDIVKLDSNLAAVINILSREDLSYVDNKININSFEIERKINFNNLIKAKIVIDEYQIHHYRVVSKYSEFDSQGANKSLSVLHLINKTYIKISQNHSLSDDEVFFDVIEEIIEKVVSSANYEVIPIDELDLCVHILIVDAFIRCKIFTNPENYNYVASN